MSTTTRRHNVPPKQTCDPTLMVACGKPTATQPGPKGPPAINPERIRARAYEIFWERNGRYGDATSDWLQAERELTAPCNGPDGPKMCGTLSEYDEARAEAWGTSLLQNPG